MPSHLIKQEKHRGRDCQALLLPQAPRAASAPHFVAFPLRSSCCHGWCTWWHGPLQQHKGLHLEAEMKVRCSGWVSFRFHGSVQVLTLFG